MSGPISASTTRAASWLTPGICCNRSASSAKGRAGFLLNLCIELSQASVDAVDLLEMQLQHEPMVGGDFSPQCQDQLWSSSMLARSPRRSKSRNRARCPAFAEHRQQSGVLVGLRVRLPVELSRIIPRYRPLASTSNIHVSGCRRGLHTRLPVSFSCFERRAAQLPSIGERSPSGSRSHAP
jgi:hypothetical protein